MIPEDMHKIMNLKDAYSHYTLTSCQAELIDRLAEFLESQKESVFLLKGYAGTGKSFVTSGLIEYFKTVGRTFLLLAPTGKAAKVIEKKTHTPASTIHRAIYSFNNLVEYRQVGLQGSETFKYYFEVAANEMPYDSIVIVDEASMISDIYNEEEFFRCGSGHLLRDLFEFLNLDLKNHRKKVIFIGDEAQLSPIRMGFSPALNPDYLLEKHKVHSMSHELKEVVRQKAESGVIENSIKLRESLGRNIYNQLTIDFSLSDLQKVESQNLIHHYLQSCKRMISDESIIIAYDNSSVAAYNRAIREHFFPGEMDLTCGDKVLVVSNSNAYDFFIANGDFGFIKEVLGNTESRTITLRQMNDETKKVQEREITLAFRDVVIEFIDLAETPRNLRVKIVESLLYNGHAGLTSDEKSALYVDFCIRRKDLKRGSDEYTRCLKSDPYFNALRLKFGYAVTCHKAQGSEWDHVFVNCSTNFNQLSASYFRWLYTAITRTSKELYLLNPPDIKLGSGIKAVGSKLMKTMDKTAPPKASLPKDSNVQSAATEAESSETEKEDYFYIPADSHLSREILKRVRNQIADSDFTIQSVGQHPYLDCYFLHKGNEVTRININYNGKGRITQVASQGKNELSASALELFLPLKGELIAPKARSSDTQFEFGKEHLEEFHKRLTLLTEAKGIQIHSVQSKPWMQRYTFLRSGEMAVFDIHYNSKHRFTSCKPLLSDCSSETFLLEIESIFTEEFNK